MQTGAVTDAETNTVNDTLTDARTDPMSDIVTNAANYSGTDKYID